MKTLPIGTEQMTKEDLRRKIAEVLGWTEVAILTAQEIHPSSPAPILILMGVPPGADRRLKVPDWPDDPGAALALCLEIGEVAIGEERGDPQVGAPHGYFAHFGNNPRGVKYATTPSEALARLALAALEAQRVNA